MSTGPTSGKIALASSYLKAAGHQADWFFKCFDEAREHFAKGAESLAAAFDWAVKLQENLVSIEGHLLPHDENHEPLDDGYRERRRAWRQGAKERVQIRRELKYLEESLRDKSLTGLATV